MNPGGARVLTGRRVLIIALGFFLTFLIPNFVLMWKAIGTFSGLAVPDGYVASQEFDRLRTAQIALGWTLDLDHTDDALTLSITDRHGAVVRPRALAVTVGRPTTTRDDQTLSLVSIPGGYAAPANFAPGGWRVEIRATAEDGTAFHQSRDVLVSR